MTTKSFFKINNLIETKYIFIFKGFEPITKITNFKKFTILISNYKIFMGYILKLEYKTIYINIESVTENRKILNQY